MRRVFIGILGGLACCLALSTAAPAASHDPADYPLRVHILKSTWRSSHSRDSNRAAGLPDYLSGQGGAGLFDNGQPQGFEFRFSCQEPLLSSSAYATYAARWKKNGKTLEILVPEAGKPWNMEPCDLQVALRPGLAYFWNDDDGTVVEESAAVFKAWMVKHHYDPEKDMDMPIEDAPAPSGSGEPGSSSSQQGPQ